jgi:hypothetical protein
MFEIQKVENGYILRVISMREGGVGSGNPFIAMQSPTVVKEYVFPTTKKLFIALRMMLS